MINESKIFFIIIILLLPYFLISETFDNELWSRINFEIPIYKDFDINLSRELRLNNNWNDISWHITDLDLKYNFSKYFAASFKYRYKYYQKEWQKIYYLNTYFDFRFWQIKTDYRLRIQKKNRFEQKDDYVKIKRDEDFIRNLILFKYDTDTWIEPYFGFELFYLFNNDKYSDRFSVIRYYFGLSIDIISKHKLKLFYINEREFNIENPNISNIVGIEFLFKFSQLFK